MFTTPTHPLRAWPLSALSRNQATAFNTIAQHAQQLPLTLAEQPWLLSLSPTTAEPHMATTNMVCATMEWAGSPWQLWLPSNQVQWLVQTILPQTPLPQLPASLYTPVLQAALSPLLHQLSQLQRGPASLLSLETSALLAPHTFCLNWQLHPSQTSVSSLQGWLHTDSLGLMTLAGVLTQNPSPQMQSDPQLPVPLHLTLGTSELNPSELHELAPGDVLLITHNHLQSQRSLWLSAGPQAGLHVQLSDNHQDLSQLIVLQTWSSAMPSLVPDAEAASTMPTALDEIPVQVSFDLGEIQLSLAEVAALRPGQAITLAHPPAGSVRIRANGALIGLGDLVEIDGQMGVCISHIHPATVRPAAVITSHASAIDTQDVSA